jgi:hypothetical protein
VSLVSNNSQLNSDTPADFFLTGSTTYSQTHLAVVGATSNLSAGFNLRPTDKLNISYQKVASD